MPNSKITVPLSTDTSDRDQIIESHSGDLAGDQIGVSVIVFEDVAHQPKLISDIRAQFRGVGTEIEFVIVSSTGIKLTPLSDSQCLKSAQNLDAAIRSCKFDSIAIMDGVFQFSISQWNLVQSEDSENTLQSWSYRATKAPRSRRLFATIYAMVINWLFGIKKNRLTPGLIFFKKQTLDGINLRNLDLASVDAVSQLLAQAKIQGRTIKEHRCSCRQPDLEWQKGQSRSPHFPNSKLLKRSISKNLQFWFCQLAFPCRIEKHESTFSSWKNLAATGVLLAVAAILLFSNASFPLFEPDETRNAQLAINILETGNWIELELRNEPYWDKPPLLAWLTATSYRCFGISEFTTRLPSLIGSMLMIVFMVVAGSKLIGFRAASIGTAAMLMAWGFVFQSRYVTMDALLALFSTVAILGIGVGAVSSRRSQRLWWIAAGIAIGLGTLTKGPICLVIALPPVLIWMMLNREINSSRIRSMLKYTCLPAAAIALPWFIMTSIRSPGFLQHFLWKHHFVRFSDAFNHEEPFWYFIPVVLVIMFPASILLPRALFFVVSRKQRYRDCRTPAHGLLAIASVWIIGFFSLSDCKLPAYILPAVPLIAFLIGIVFEYEFNRIANTRTRFDKLAKRIALGMTVMIAICGAVIMFWIGQPQEHLVSAAVIASIVAVSVPIALKKRTARRIAPWCATGAIAIVFVFQGVNQLVPALSNQRSILRSLANADEIPIESPIVYFGRDTHAASIYVPEKNVVWFREENIEDVTEYLQLNRKAHIVASEANVDRIREQLPNAVIGSSNIRHTYSFEIAHERTANREMQRTDR